MKIVKRRALYMPTLNSYFVYDFDERVATDIKQSRLYEIGGDKYISSLHAWEISKEVFALIEHYPHTFIDESVPKPEPLILQIGEGEDKYLYQEQAAQILRERKEALLFFDTGTGKTRTALLALSRLAKDSDALIVVGQSNLSKVWKEQAEQFFPEFASRLLPLSQDPSVSSRIERIKNAPEGTVFILNIESMRKDALVASINARNLAVCILDECQCIIGKTAQQTQGMHSVNAPFRWALSATPILNSPLEWHSLLAWLRLMPLDGMFTRFKDYYGVKTRNKFGQIEYKTFRNQEDLEDLKNFISIRVEKSGLGLLPRTDIDMEFPMSEQLSKQLATLHKWKRKEWIDYTALVGTEEVHAENAPTLFYMERAFTAMAQEKIDFIKSFSEPCIVVSCLKQPLNVIHSQIEDSVLYHGDLSAQDRQRALDDFKSGKKRVLLMTRQCGGVGLTLTNARLMFFIDAPENEAMFNQCADRVYRIGQTQQVFIYRLKTIGTIDSYSWDRLRDKQSWIDMYFKTNYGGQE